MGIGLFSQVTSNRTSRNGLKLSSVCSVFLASGRLYMQLGSLRPHPGFCPIDFVAGDDLEIN